MLSLLQHSIVLCFLSRVWCRNIKLNLLPLIQRFLKKFYGVIITSIQKQRNSQKNHKLAIKKELLFNLS